MSQPNEQPGQELQETRQAVERAMHERQYERAATLAEGALQTATVDAGYFRYVLALSHFYRQDFAMCERVLSTLLAGKDDVWRRKGRFLQARVHVGRKEYAAAEKIFAAEANYLHTVARKEEIGRVYVEMADAFARLPLPHELDALPPDYDKACRLYQKALELNAGDSFSDDIAFRLGQLRHQQASWAQAQQQFAGYLAKYDPDWQGWPGRQVASPATVVGKQRELARLRLAESLLAGGDRQAAVWVLEDLLPFLASKSAHPQKQDLRHDALWQLTRCHYPADSDERLTQSVNSLRRYLAEFPAGRHSVQAAYDIAAAYQTRGQTEEAVCAYRDFLQGKGYQVSPLAVEAGKESAADTHARLRKDATYELGRLHFARKEYDQAIAVWQSYIDQFSDGPRWAAAQSGIVDVEYLRGKDLVAARKYDEARAVWEKFLARYPLDTRQPRILYTFAQIRYQLALDEKDRIAAGQPRQSSAALAELFRNAVEEWERLIAKYGASEEAQAALFMCGRVHEEELQDLAQALAIYRRVNRHPWAGWAQQNIARMTAPGLTVETPRVYRSDEKAVLAVKLRNVAKLTVKSYRLNLEEYFRRQHTILGVERLDLALIEANDTREIEVSDYRDYLPLRQEIAVPLDGPGACAVEISSDKRQEIMLVVKSDIHLVLKGSKREVLVFVQNMRDMKPAAGARVLVSDGNKIVASGVTDAQGVFLQKIPELKDAVALSVLAMQDGHVAADLLSLSDLGLSHGLTAKGYIVSDRPLYQPGDVVRLRAILREVENGSYVVPQAKYRFALFDPQGRCLVSEAAPLSVFGTAHKDFVLAPQATIGDYRVEFRREDEKQSFSNHFTVSHVQLEKVRLALTFAQRVVYRGEKVEGTFSARYYYGTPVVGKTIRYTLPDNRTLSGETDHEGNLRFSFDTARETPGQSLSFSGVLAEDNVRVTERVELAKYEFGLGVEPASKKVVAGDTVEIKLTSKDAAGKPLAARTQLVLYRRVTIPADPVLKALPWDEGGVADAVAETRIEQRDIATDANTGIARLNFVLTDAGDYVVRARSQDRFGNTVSGEAIVMATSADDTPLRIMSERQHTKMGEQLGVEVKSKLPQQALALVTCEGETILAYRLLTLNRGGNPHALAIGADYFPNFRLCVTVLGQNEWFETSRNFTVERELKVQAKFAKPHCQPGEKIPVSIRATDHLGRPVTAELSLALVDEALFAAGSDERQSIVEFFQRQAQRTAFMRTSASARLLPPPAFVPQATLRQTSNKNGNKRGRGERLALGTVTKIPSSQTDNDKDYGANIADESDRREQTVEFGRDDTSGYFDMRSSGEVAPDEPAAPDVRREVESQGWWLPAIVTDAQGEATADITMPEKTSEWRLTAIGCTVETLVGECKESIVTRRDFFVDVKLPPLFMQGDNPRLVARVHNLTDYAGPVELLLELAAIDRPSERSRTLGSLLELFTGDGLRAQTREMVISAQATGELVFDAIHVPAALGLGVRLTARVPGKEWRDTLVRSVPVRPWGMPYASHVSGEARGDATLFVTLPERSYDSRWLNIVIGPSVSRTILDMALDASPYAGGAYGVMPGELLAAASASMYARDVRCEAGDYQRLQARTRMLAATLIATQNRDGGFGLVPGQPSHPVVSARALWALTQAKESGVAVAAELLEQAIAYVEKEFTRLPHDDEESKALLHYALALAGKGDFAVANRLYRQRATLGVAALSYTTLLLARLDKGEMAGELLDLLASQKAATGDTGTSMWPHARNSSWTASDAENSALVALAFMAVRQDSPLVGEIVRHLMMLRHGMTFAPAHAHGTAVAALCRYYARARYAASDYRLEIAVNDQPLTTIAGKDNTPTVSLQVPSALIVSGRNKVEMRLLGSGVYTYAVTLHGFSSDLSDPKSWAYPQLEHRIYRHMPLTYNGSSIGVGSSTLVRNMEATQMMHVCLIVKKDAPEGEQATEKGHSDYLMLEESIPAGTMLVRGSVRGSFTHLEESPGMLRVYFSPRQPLTSVCYEVAAYAPGTYRALPTIMRDVHDPSRLRVGPAAELTVLAPGERSKDGYAMNQDELYALGSRYFNDQRYAEALSHLCELMQKSPTYNQSEVARMLLWIYTEDKHYDAAKMVEVFEILKEKSPSLYIPFHKILQVQKAYRDLKEFERAYLVAQATIEASFTEESKVAAALEEQGQILAASDYLRRLWLDYHDSASVVQAHFAISQRLYARLQQLERLHDNMRLGSRVQKRTTVTREQVLGEVTTLLREFLALYPESAQADDATFSLASTCLAGKRFAEVIELAHKARERYRDSLLASAFAYMEALGHFARRDYAMAIAAAEPVANGDSKDSSFATYILGQVYHAQDRPAQAVVLYRKVADRFPDAREAANYLESRMLRVPEVKEAKPGDKVELEIASRNIREVHFLVYRVDLMKLSLQHRDLAHIDSVKLSGIRPVVSQQLALASKDFCDIKTVVTLPIAEEGAYLVLCRGEELFASGLLLVTPLELAVQEEADSQRLRAYVVNRITGGKPEGVRVQVLASGTSLVAAGETDLRGIFIADNVVGKATVVARSGERAYAFYRGDTWLGPQPLQPGMTPAQPCEPSPVIDKPAARPNDSGLESNLDDFNREIQQENMEKLEKSMRSTEEGVLMDNAY